MGKGRQICWTIALGWIASFSLIAAEDTNTSSSAFPSLLESVPDVPTNAPPPVPPPVVPPTPVKKEKAPGGEPDVKLADPVAERAMGHLTIESPHPDGIVASGEIQIFFKMVGSEVPEEEQMVHVFINNEPPVLHQDLRRPFILKGLPSGAVFVRALAVDGRGVAFPLPDSFASTRFFIRSRDFRNNVDPSESFLTLNLPFVGKMATDEANNLPMQFFVHLGAGKEGTPMRVRYILNGVSKEVNHDGTILLNKLQYGRHHLRVELLQPDGTPEPGTFSFAEREFEILRILKPLPMGPRDPSELPL